MLESEIQKRVMVRACTNPNVRVFRNNTGVGWQGKQIKSEPGTVKLANARPLRAGLIKGSSDLIGWKTVEITPEMVGQKLAVFTAIEVKQPGKYATKEQKIFLENVKNAGGIAIIAKNEKDAEI